MGFFCFGYRGKVALNGWKKDAENGQRLDDKDVALTANRFFPFGQARKGFVVEFSDSTESQ